MGNPIVDESKKAFALATSDNYEFDDFDKLSEADMLSQNGNDKSESAVQPTPPAEPTKTVQKDTADDNDDKDDKDKDKDKSKDDKLPEATFEPDEFDLESPKTQFDDLLAKLDEPDRKKIAKAISRSEEDGQFVQTFKPIVDLMHRDFIGFVRTVAPDFVKMFDTNFVEKTLIQEFGSDFLDTEYSEIEAMKSGTKSNKYRKRREELERASQEIGAKLGMGAGQVAKEISKERQEGEKFFKKTVDDLKKKFDISDEELQHIDRVLYQYSHNPIMLHSLAKKYIVLYKKGLTKQAVLNRAEGTVKDSKRNSVTPTSPSSVTGSSKSGSEKEIGFLGFKPGDPY